MGAREGGRRGDVVSGLQGDMSFRVQSVGFMCGVYLCVESFVECENLIECDVRVVL